MKNILKITLMVAIILTIIISLFCLDRYMYQKQEEKNLDKKYIKFSNKKVGKIKSKVKKIFLHSILEIIIWKSYLRTNPIMYINMILKRMEKSQEMHF